MEKYLIANFSEDETQDRGMAAFLSNPENRALGREPVLAKMPNGTLVCVFLTGGPTEPHNKNVVTIKRSYDDGKTWTDLEILFQHSFQGLWATEIYCGFEKPMMVVTMYNADYPCKAMQSYVSFTDDNGETWSEPAGIVPAFATASVRQGIRLKNGDTLLPIYYNMPRKSFYWDVKNYYKPGWWDGSFSECAVAISSDGGKNFERYGRVWQEGASLWEPSCVEAEDGHIIMFIRQDRTGRLGRCDSYDGGKTWGEYALTDLPNAGSKLSLFKVGDAIGLIANFFGEKRTHLEIRISRDFGKTFTESIPLDDPEAIFCYPHAFVDEQEKKVYVAYENYHQQYLKIFTWDELNLS